MALYIIRQSPYREVSYTGDIVMNKPKAPDNSKLIAQQQEQLRAQQAERAALSEEQAARLRSRRRGRDSLITTTELGVLDGGAGGKTTRTGV